MATSARRIWFRFAFSLRTLFLVLTGFGVWLGWQLSIVRERKSVLAEIKTSSPPVTGPTYIHSRPDDPRFCLTLEAMEDARDPAADKYQYARVPLVRRILGDASYVRITLPTSISLDVISRIEYSFDESALFMCADGGCGTIAFRDSLLAPPSVRRSNSGTRFTTGLIEKPQ